MVAIADLEQNIRTIIENMDTDTIASMLTSRENGTIKIGDFKVTRTKQNFYNVYWREQKLYEDIALAKTAKTIVESLINEDQITVKKAIDLDNQYMSKLYETTMYGQKANRTDNPVYWAKYSENQVKLEQIKSNIL